MKEPWEMTRAEYDQAVDKALGKLGNVEAYAEKQSREWATSGHPVSKQAIVAQYRNHRAIIEQAMKDHLPVSNSILRADYPDLYAKRPSLEESMSYMYLVPVRQCARNCGRPVSELSYAHRESVKDAIRAGKVVPSVVLAEYPDLERQAKRKLPINVKTKRVRHSSPRLSR